MNASFDGRQLSAAAKKTLKADAKKAQQQQKPQPTS